MRGWRDDVHAGQTGALRHGRAQRAELRAGRGDLREDAPRQVELPEQAAGPIALERVQALRGAGDGELGYARAAQCPVQEVRDEEQRVGGGEHVRMRLLVGEQLEERVELHELQAGLGEDFGARHALERLFHDAVGAGIAVGERLAQHLAPLVQQHVIHAPRVRADGDDAFAELLASEREAGLDFVPEAQHVPAQAVGEEHRAVGEAMDFFELEGLAVPEAGDDAAAFSSEINGEIDLGFHGGGESVVSSL